jgi:MFS family permease
LSTQPARPALREILSRDTLPIFSVFFSWSFGTGALWLVRPLFAYEIGGSFFAVALISATSAMPRLLMGPLSGYLSDRWGRRLFVLIGSSLGTIALTTDFFVNAYWQFLMLEVVVGTGIALYMTSSNLLMADATRTATRGRAMGVRQVSSRMGNLLGPVVAGGIAAAFGLRYVFLFIALTKVAVFLVTFFWIRDMRPERAKVSPTATEGQGSKRRLPDLSMFRNRSFFTLAAVTLALGLVNGGTGVFRTLFPPQMEIVAGVSESQIGLLIAVAGLTGLLVSVPVGIVSDRYGRKRLMVVGLLITAVATYLMAITIGFASAMIAVVVFGVAEAIGQGTMQVYAMDLAPVERRGAFIGVWTLFTSIGQVTGPLIVGTVADVWGFTTAFVTVVIFLVLAAFLMAVFGKETRRGAPG